MRARITTSSPRPRCIHRHQVLQSRLKSGEEAPCLKDSVITGAVQSTGSRSRSRSRSTASSAAAWASWSATIITGTSSARFARGVRSSSSQDRRRAVMEGFLSLAMAKILGARSPVLPSPASPTSRCSRVRLPVGVTASFAMLVRPAHRGTQGANRLLCRCRGHRTSILQKLPKLFSRSDSCSKTSGSTSRRSP